MPGPVGIQYFQEWQTYEITVAGGGGGLSNANISPGGSAVAAPNRLIVRKLKVMVSAAATTVGGTGARIGFSTSTLPAGSTTPVSGILLSHPGIAAGSGLDGCWGIGAQGAELIATVADPTAGSVVITYEGRLTAV